MKKSKITPKNNEAERRFFSSEMTIEQRAAGDDDERPTIVGYAAIFDSLSEDLGGFREMIDPGAFAGTLGDDIKALFNHDSDQVPLGRTKAGTLELSTDKTGLRVVIDPPATPFGDNVVGAIRRGDIDQMSFGFRTIEDKWRETDDGDIIRTLLEVRLFEVSPVSFPAYPQTQVAVRSLEQWIDETKPPFSQRDHDARELALMALE